MARARRVVAVAASLMALALPAWAANQVLIVDSTAPPVGAYTTIQAAIDAAQDGDLLRVQPGNYPGFVLDGKSLSIVAEPVGTLAGEFIRTGNVEIRNLGSGQKALLRGFHVDVPESAGALVWLHDNAGPVILEDLFLQTYSFTATEIPVLLVEDSDRVSVTRCELLGRDITGQQPGAVYPKGAGLAVTSSSVFVYDGSIRGGDGLAAYVHPFGIVIPGTSGGPAVLLFSGSLFVAGTEVTGGSGGSGGIGFTGAPCAAGYDGGPGIVVGGKLSLLGASVAGGAAGITPLGACPTPGVPGPATLVISGGVNTFNESARGLTVSAPIFLGGNATLTASGAPGEIFTVLLSTSPSVTFVPAAKGALLGTLPAIPLLLGPLPQSGELVIQTTVPSGALPPGVDGVELYLQGHFPGSTGTGMLSSPSATTVLR